MSFAMHTYDCFVKIKMADKTDEKRYYVIYSKCKCVYIFYILKTDHSFSSNF